MEVKTEQKLNDSKSKKTKSKPQNNSIHLKVTIGEMLEAKGILLSKKKVA
jgi:hypothetical protein